MMYRRLRGGSTCSQSCGVEVAPIPDTAAELDFTPDEWTAFIRGVHAGEFNLLAA